ncbi:hypothetical protein AVEN_128362-1 [Araneus ventricosus]|uniref:Uncharacterized protein n=1 Tax=Araneus ventricosus TaxID=182803 RepID=A0A4Y2DCA0_ARAVE|nr:hypothetical protein AVEN_128362-1 [Araneus ventricosus]
MKAPKCATTALRSPYRSSSNPNFSSPHRADFRLSSLVTRSNLCRSFDVPQPSYRDPKLKSANELLDFEFVGIPDLPFRCANFHRFLKLTIAFCFPCSKHSILEEM